MNIIRKIAEKQPELRKHLVPILKQSFTSDIRLQINGKKLSDIMPQAKLEICHKLGLFCQESIFTVLGLIWVKKHRK